MKINIEFICTPFYWKEVITEYMVDIVCSVPERKQKVTRVMKVPFKEEYFEDEVLEMIMDRLLEDVIFCVQILMHKMFVFTPLKQFTIANALMYDMDKKTFVNISDKQVKIRTDEIILSEHFENNINNISKQLNNARNKALYRMVELDKECLNG